MAYKVFVTYVTLVITGGSGIETTVTGAEDARLDVRPKEFVADTVNVYWTPDRSPVTIPDRSDITVIPILSGEETTL
jgi:hypothetical protein